MISSPCFPPRAFCRHAGYLFQFFHVSGPDYTDYSVTFTTVYRQAPFGYKLIVNVISRVLFLAYKLLCSSAARRVLCAACVGWLEMRRNQRAENRRAMTDGSLMCVRPSMRWCSSHRGLPPKPPPPPPPPLPPASLFVPPSFFFTPPSPAHGVVSLLTFI
jgi:hypothetical protein